MTGLSVTTRVDVIEGVTDGGVGSWNPASLTTCLGEALGAASTMLTDGLFTFVNRSRRSPCFEGVIKDSDIER